MLTGVKIAKIANFWYNFAKKGNTLNRFLQNMAWGLPGSHPHAKFYRFGSVNVGLRPKKSPKMVTFGINLPKRDIYKILPGEGAPGPHPRAKFHRCSFINVAVRLQKSQKNGNLGKNLPLEKNSEGRYENLNIGAQLQTFLYAMTP